MTRVVSFAAVAVLAVASAAPGPSVVTSLAPDSIAPNDNRTAAGTLDNGVLTVALEARTGSWHPEGEQGRGVDVAAFAEEGKSLSTPGPLIRMPLGTQIRATIRNRLDKPLIVYRLRQDARPRRQCRRARRFGDAGVLHGRRRGHVLLPGANEASTPSAAARPRIRSCTG